MIHPIIHASYMLIHFIYFHSFLMETQERLFVLQHAEACASLPRGGKQSHLSRVLKFISPCPFSAALNRSSAHSRGVFAEDQRETAPPPKIRMRK